MVEVQCETDFVAKNNNFLELVNELAEKLSQVPVQSVDVRENAGSINKIWIIDQGRLDEIAGSSVRDAITKLGENIRFVRGCIMKINPGGSLDACLLPYTHSVSGKLASNNPQILLGKYGTIIAIKKAAKETTTAEESPSHADPDQDESLSSNSIEEIGSKIGQHIIGLSPMTVAESNINGKVIEDPVGDEEPTALLKQKFIFNEDITVETFLKNSNAEVVDFIRLECGGGSNEE